MTFCKAFNVCYLMALITLITLVFLLIHSYIANLVRNFFGQKTKSAFGVSHLWSIHNEKTINQIFLVILPSVNPNCFVFCEVDQKPFGQSPIWTIKYPRFLFTNYAFCYRMYHPELS